VKSLKSQSALLRFSAPSLQNTKITTINIFFAEYYKLIAVQIFCRFFCWDSFILAVGETPAVPGFSLLNLIQYFGVGFGFFGVPAVLAIATSAYLL
jgi:hypothetical protein